MPGYAAWHPVDLGQQASSVADFSAHAGHLMQPPLHNQPATQKPGAAYVVPARGSPPRYHLLHPLLPPPGTAEAGAGLPPTLPVFTPAGGPQSAMGLNLLASVAIGTPNPHTTGTKTDPAATVQLHAKGPYNPAALLPTKVAKKVLELEFVEMTEITLNDPPAPSAGHPPLPARPPIHNISVWIEKYSIMAALLASRFPQVGSC